jgi:hypothetical protein
VDAFRQHEALRWLASRLTWEQRLNELRAEAAEPTTSKGTDSEPLAA